LAWPEATILTDYGKPIVRVASAEESPNAKLNAQQIQSFADGAKE
jgi:hypothetical protein